MPERSHDQQSGLPRAGRSFLRAALFFALGGVVAAAIVRYGLIQPPSLAWACQVEARPLWCSPRQGMIVLLQAGAIGWIALAAGCGAILGGGRRWCAWATGLGAAALMLYSAGAGALAVLLGVLRALRV